MTSAVADSQRRWHPDAASYRRDGDELSAEERAAWDVVVNANYPPDVRDDAVPKAEAVQFYSIDKGGRQFSHVASVQVTPAQRLWSARIFSVKPKRKTPSRLEAIKVLAAITSQHFLNYDGSRRSAAVLARVKMLTGISSYGIDEAAYAVSSRYATQHSASQDHDFLSAINLRNKTFKGLGIQTGSMVGVVTGFLVESETDVDVAVGLDRLRILVEATAEALMDLGVVRVRPKNPSTMTRQQQTKLKDYRFMIKIQANLVSAACLKDSENRQQYSITRWLDNYYRLVGIALQMMCDYMKGKRQPPDDLVDRAIAALERRLDIQASPSASAAHSPSTSNSRHDSYFVDLASPGPSSPSKATPRGSRRSATPPPSSPAHSSVLAATPGSTSSSFKGRLSSLFLGRAPGAAPPSTPPRPPSPSSPSGARATVPSASSVGPPPASPSASPQSPGAGAALVTLLRRILPSPTASRTPASTPTCSGSKAQASPAHSATSSPSAAQAGPSGTQTVATSSPASQGPHLPPQSSPSAAVQLASTTSAASDLPGFLFWDFDKLPTTATELHDFIGVNHIWKGFPTGVTTAGVAFMPRAHKCSSQYWKEGKIPDTLAALRDAGSELGISPSNGFGDAVLICLTTSDHLLVQLKVEKNWRMPYLTAQPEQQRAILLFCGFLSLITVNLLKTICVADILEAVWHLRDSDGAHVMPPYSAFSGSAFDFFKRIWELLFRPLDVRVYRMAEFVVREERRCTECGHRERFEFSQPFLSVPTVEKDVPVGGLFSVKRTEKQDQKEVTIYDICAYWRSERLVDGGEHVCAKCLKDGTTVATSEAIHVPHIAVFHLDMEKELPRRVRLPAWQFDLARLLQDGAPPSAYFPKAYILHHGADVTRGHHTTLAKPGGGRRWFYHDSRASGPAPKVSESRLENEATPTLGRPVLLLFEQFFALALGSKRIPDDGAFIMTQANRDDDGGATLAPRPDQPTPLAAKRARKSP